MNQPIPTLVQEPAAVTDWSGEGTTVSMPDRQLETLADVIHWAAYHDGEIKEKWRNADRLFRETGIDLRSLRELTEGVKDKGSKALSLKVAELYSEIQAQNTKQDEAIEALRLEFKNDVALIWKKIGGIAAGLAALGGSGFAAFGG